MTEYALQLSEAELARYRLMAEWAFERERHLWTTAGIVEGATVADVGCGPGAVSALLGQIVGPEGGVSAVDRDPGALAAARALAEASGLTNVRFGVGDADDTGLDRGTFDAVMMRHVIAHNGGREQNIVDHLAQLVRPGACVYLIDIEATAIRMRPDDPDLRDLSDRYFRFQTERGNDVSVGLRLGDLLQSAGLEVLAFEGRYDVIPARAGFRPPSWAAREAMIDAGVATPADVERWAAAFARLDEATRPPTMFIPCFVAVGRRLSRGGPAVPA